MKPYNIFSFNSCCISIRIVALTFLIVSISLISNAEKAEKKNNGFISLFNEVDLNGWTVKCKVNDSQKNCRSVKDGCIEVNTLSDSAHNYNFNK